MVAGMDFENGSRMIDEMQKAVVAQTLADLDERGVDIDDIVCAYAEKHTQVRVQAREQKVEAETRPRPEAGAARPRLTPRPPPQPAPSTSHARRARDKVTRELEDIIETSKDTLADEVEALIDGSDEVCDADKHGAGKSLIKVGCSARCASCICYATDSITAVAATTTTMDSAMRMRPLCV